MMLDLVLLILMTLSDLTFKGIFNFYFFYSIFIFLFNFYFFYSILFYFIRLKAEYGSVAETDITLSNYLTDDQFNTLMTTATRWNNIVHQVFISDIFK